MTNRRLIIAHTIISLFAVLRPFSSHAEGVLINSDYTNSLQMLSTLKASEKAIKTITADSISMSCLSHPIQTHFVGVAHGLLIHSGIEKIIAALDDFVGYKDLFEDIEAIEVIDMKTHEVGGNKYFKVHTEQNIPVPFMPNAHVTTDYFMTRLSPTLVVYRYQLAKDPKHPNKNDVLHADGVIVIERRTEKETAFYEVDFLDPNLSGIASLGSSRIWPESVKGFALSDLALRNFAEAKTVENDITQQRQKARKMARNQLEEKVIDKCLESKISADTYLKGFSETKGVSNRVYLPPNTQAPLKTEPRL